MTDEATTSSTASKQRGEQRRVFLWLLCIGVVLIAGTAVVAGLYSASLPNSWYRNLTGRPLSLVEPPSVVRAGRPADFGTVGVYQGSRSDGFWVVHLPEKKLIAVHTFCTHDGCATSCISEDGTYGCPCCGSRFQRDGTILSGPAERPLERFNIYLKNESVLVNRSETFQFESGEWQVQGAFLSMDDQ